MELNCFDVFSFNFCIFLFVWLLFFLSFMSCFRSIPLRDIFCGLYSLGFCCCCCCFTSAASTQNYLRTQTNVWLCYAILQTHQPRCGDCCCFTGFFAVVFQHNSRIRFSVEYFAHFLHRFPSIYIYFVVFSTARFDDVLNEAFFYAFVSLVLW